MRRGMLLRPAVTMIAWVRLSLMACALLQALSPLWSLAAEHHVGFDGPEPVGRITTTGLSPEKVQHVLVDKDFAREGQGAEFVRLQVDTPGTEIEFLVDVPPTLRLDESRVALWMRCSQPSVSLHVRLRFPNQIDPRTGQPLRADLAGTRYEETSPVWKALECRPDDRAFQQLMQRLRHLLLPQLKPQVDLDARDVYIEAVVLKARLAAGRADLLVDDLVLSPLAVPQAKPLEETTTEPEAPFSRIVMGDNRSMKNGRPFIPLIVPYHHETIDQFLETGANVAWVQNHDDLVLLKEFADRGIGVTATPPRPVAGAAGESLPPFTNATSPIDFWMLDVHIPGTALTEVSRWIEQVRDADHQHPRPILADVTGREREFHRQLSLLGSSRFTLGTTTTPLEYADHLERKQRVALPGKGMFTFIPLEPADDVVHDPADGPRIEPDQLFMLGNAALSAGYKAIGYWNRNPLDEETRHALKLMNLQIRLMEPWLATGKVTGIAPVQFGPDRGTGSGTSLSSLVSTRWDNAMRKPPGERTARLEREIRATVIDGEFGMLVIINWLEDGAQYQPGPMVVDDLHLFVKRDIHQAWTMTATGLENLRLKQVPGGTEITLKQLDQYAYVLITHEQAVRDAVARQIAQLRESAARSWVELATLKLRRVHDIHRQIEFEAPAVADAAPILADADRWVAAARADLERGSFRSVEDNARQALALARKVQRRHWENAVRRFASPAAYPYTIAFRTLPQHWTMMERLGAGLPESRNLLHSERFTSLDQMVSEGWTLREAELPETIQTAIELRNSGAEGRASLRLAAGTGADAQVGFQVEEPFVQLQSPVLPVRAGQVVHASGRIRVPQSLDPASDGLAIYNTIDGPGRALRFREPTPTGRWQTFELVSEARASGEFALRFELRGLGDVFLDNLRITALDPAGIPPAMDDATPSESPGS